MEFAGREYIYLPKKKINKLNGYKSEDKKKEENAAPLPQLNPEKKSIGNKEEEKLINNLDNNLIKKEDDEISCDSNSVCTISNKHLNDKYSNSGSYEDNLSCDSIGEQHFEYKDEKEYFFQETDINIFSVNYNKILNKEFSLKENPIRCKKCQQF